MGFIILIEEFLSDGLATYLVSIPLNLGHLGT